MLNRISLDDGKEEKLRRLLENECECQIKSDEEILFERNMEDAWSVDRW